MAMSTGYHTFCCHSKDFYHCWLSYDLCGISFSLLAIYTTGIYYAFWCQNVRLLGFYQSRPISLTSLYVERIADTSCFLFLNPELTRIISLSRQLGTLLPATNLLCLSKPFSFIFEVHGESVMKTSDIVK